MRKKVLVLATGLSTKGGITSVLKIYNKMSFWENWNCYWLETHSDKNAINKILVFFKAFLLFIFLINKFTIVHAHVSWKISAIRKLPFLIISKIFRKKIILHMHASSETTYLKHPKLYKFLFQLADKIVYIYPSYIDKLDNKYATTLIYNPVDGNYYSDLSNKRKQIFFAGSIIKEKGVFDLINSFSLIVEKNKEWKLLIAGNGELKKCKKMIDELSLKKNIELLGWVQGEKKQNLLIESTIFCLPSYSEGLPMSIIEAWKYGAAVIATPVGGIPDIIKDGFNGKLVNAGDITELSKALNALMNNHIKRNFFIKNSKDLFYDHFSFEKIESQISNLYLEMH